MENVFIQLLKFWKSKKNNQPKCGKFYLWILKVTDDLEQTISYA